MINGLLITAMQKPIDKGIYVASVQAGGGAAMRIIRKAIFCDHRQQDVNTMLRR